MKSNEIMRASPPTHDLEKILIFFLIARQNHTSSGHEDKAIRGNGNKASQKRQSLRPTLGY